MRTEEEIREELEIAIKKFTDTKYCECGCMNDTIDYWRDRIRTLEWVLNE
jgi:hypothetical protein